MSLHHIITDGWSMGVLARELDHLYSMFSYDRPSQLPDLPIQYADFALWQRHRLDGQHLEAPFSFWKHELRGAIQSVQPPTDRPRPAEPGFRGGHYPIALSPALSAAARALASRAGVTPFVVLGAAFTMLLHYHSGHTDVVVGSTFANRGQRALEDLIGFFVNTLPMRYDLSGDPSFYDQLARAQKVLLGVHEHQELPLSKIVHELQPERSLDRNPLFQVVFDVLTPDRNPLVFGYGLASGVQGQLQIGNLRVTPMDAEHGEARFDLTVLLWDMPDRITGTFEYNSDVYDRSTMARLASNYESLLEHVTADPAAPLSRLCAQLRQSDHEFGQRQAEEYNVRARRTLLATKRKIIAVAGPQDD
jgi:non-ribosomal peptide synthetase component F